MSNIKLGLIGSTGRMGSCLQEYLGAHSDIVLHTALDSKRSVEQFIADAPDVVVDLSLGPAVDVHGPAIAEAGLAYIIGATGFRPETTERMRKAAERTGQPILIVPNFSLGANLMLVFAAKAAALMDSPVITERHHQGKADAPSGTASYTANKINTAREAAGKFSDTHSTAVKFHEQAPGVLGGVVNGIPVHSVRGSGYLAEQEVRLCLPGEILCIEHRSLDRRCFMSGIVYAVRNIGWVHGLQIGLETILEGV